MSAAGLPGFPGVLDVDRVAAPLDVSVSERFGEQHIAGAQVG